MGDVISCGPDHDEEDAELSTSDSRPEAEVDEVTVSVDPFADKQADELIREQGLDPKSDIRHNVEITTNRRDGVSEISVMQGDGGDVDFQDREEDQPLPTAASISTPVTPRSPEERGEVGGEASGGDDDVKAPDEPADRQATDSPAGDYAKGGSDASTIQGDGNASKSDALDVPESGAHRKLSVESGGDSTVEEQKPEKLQIVVKVQFAPDDTVSVSWVAQPLTVPLTVLSDESVTRLTDRLIEASDEFRAKHEANWHVDINTHGAPHRELRDTTIRNHDPLGPGLLPKGWDPRSVTYWNRGVREGDTLELVAGRDDPVPYAESKDYDEFAPPLIIVPQSGDQKDGGKGVSGDEKRADLADTFDDVVSPGADDDEKTENENAHSEEDELVQPFYTGSIHGYKESYRDLQEHMLRFELRKEVRNMRNQFAPGRKFFSQLYVFVHTLYDTTDRLLDYGSNYFLSFSVYRASVGADRPVLVRRTKLASHNSRGRFTFATAQSLRLLERFPAYKFILHICCWRYRKYRSHELVGETKLPFDRLYPLSSHTIVPLFRSVKDADVTSELMKPSDRFLQMDPDFWGRLQPEDRPVCSVRLAMWYMGAADCSKAYHAYFYRKALEVPALRRAYCLFAHNPSLERAYKTVQAWRVDAALAFAAEDARSRKQGFELSPTLAKLEEQVLAPVKKLDVQGGSGRRRRESQVNRITASWLRDDSDTDTLADARIRLLYARDMDIPPFVAETKCLPNVRGCGDVKTTRFAVVARNIMVHYTYQIDMQEHLHVFAKDKYLTMPLTMHPALWGVSWWRLSIVVPKWQSAVSSLEVVRNNSKEPDYRMRKKLMKGVFFGEYVYRVDTHYRQHIQLVGTPVPDVRPFPLEPHPMKLNAEHSRRSRAPGTYDEELTDLDAVPTISHPLDEKLQLPALDHPRYSKVRHALSADMDHSVFTNEKMTIFPRALRVGGDDDDENSGHVSNVVVCQMRLGPMVVLVGNIETKGKKCIITGKGKYLPSTGSTERSGDNPYVANFTMERIHGVERQMFEDWYAKNPIKEEEE